MTTFYAVASDNKTTLSLVLRNGPSATSTPLDLTTATEVKMNGLASAKTCTFAADATGAVSVELVAADLVAGVYDIEWQVTFSDTTVATFPDPGNDWLVVRPQIA